MAKKNEAISPFVPTDEQPYKIPDNWCWIRLGSVLKEIKNGTTIKQDKSGSGYWVTRIESLQNQTIDFNRLGSIVNEQDIKDTDWYLTGDIALSHINSAEHVGKTALITSDMLPLVHGMNLLRLRFHKNCILTFFQYYSQSYQYKGEILARINMAVNQVSINQKQLSSLEFPLPPLAEQQRIVSRIESLFAKLDEAKEKAQAVVDGFELRKSAILHKAFSGELTEQWRKEHKAEEWFMAKLGQYTESQYGYTESASIEPIGPKFLRITDIQNGTVNWDNVPYCNISQENFEKYSIRPGDIMIARTGATTGKSYLVAEDVSAVFASYLIRLTLKQQGLIAAYLYNFMQSQGYWQQITEFSAGIAQPGVNAKKLKEIKLPIPSILEQNEIVSALDKILKKEQQAKESAEAVLDQIDTMKKAILARAFRGELGTNDPKEEWAGELLKTVL